MSPDPEADAFIRAILRQPDEVATRLVFADWLDERGGPANEAWAQYIRANAGYAQSGRADDITARLIISAAKLLEDPASLFLLLPAANFTVRLGDIEIRRSVVECVPESVARENVFLPLHSGGRKLLVAAAEPRDRDLIDRLDFVLNVEATAVRAELDDVRDAINRHYGQTETESIDCVSYESPLVGLAGDDVSGHLFSLFFTAFSRGMSGFELVVEGDDCRLAYLNRNGVADIGFIPTAAFRRLRDHLRALPVVSESAEDGVRTVTVDIPLLSGRRFPAAVTLRRRWLQTKQLRVDFLW
jgi:uncharacterized protein (TIGR02996 family)